MNISQSYRFMPNQIDLFIKDKLSGNKIISSSSDAQSGSDLTINGYKSQITNAKSSATFDLVSKQTAIDNFEMPNEPVESEFPNNEDYQKALDTYNNDMQTYEKLIEERDNLKKEIEKYDEILAQLDDLKGQDVPQDLVEKVDSALQANKERKIVSLGDYISVNEDAMDLIKSFKLQQQTIVDDAKKYNDDIKNLGKVPEPVFANFINEDGTIDVSGYENALRDFKDAQNEILDKIEELKKLDKKNNKIKSVLDDLAGAENPEDFQAKVNEYKGYSFDSIFAEGLDTNRTFDVINNEIEDVQGQIKTLADEKNSLANQAEGVYADISALLLTYESALGNAPKLTDFVDGEGYPDVKAFNDAVKDYNDEQERRLEEIEKKINELVECEKQSEKIDKQLDELNKKLEQLEEEAKKVKEAEETQEVSTNNTDAYKGKWALVRIKASDLLKTDIAQLGSPFMGYVSFYRASDGLRIDDDISGDESTDNTDYGDISRIAAQGDNYIYINLPYSVIQGQLRDLIANDSPAAGVYSDESVQFDHNPENRGIRQIRFDTLGEPDTEFIKNGGYNGDSNDYRTAGSGSSGGSVSVQKNAGSRLQPSAISGARTVNNSVMTATNSTSDSSSNSYSNKWGLVKIKASDFLSLNLPYPIQGPDGKEYYVCCFNAAGERIDNVTAEGRSSLDNTVEGDLGRIAAQGDEYIYINLPYSIIQGALLNIIKGDDEAGVYSDDDDHFSHNEYGRKDRIINLGEKDTEFIENGGYKSGVTPTQATSSVSYNSSSSTNGWSYVKIKASKFIEALKKGIIPPGVAKVGIFSATRHPDDDGRFGSVGYKLNYHNDSTDSHGDGFSDADIAIIQAQGDNYVYINLPYSIIQGALLDEIVSDPDAGVYPDNDNFVTYWGTDWDPDVRRPRLLLSPGTPDPNY